MRGPAPPSSGERLAQIAKVETVLLEETNHTHFSLPKLHASEIRRYFEGRRQRALDERAARQAGSNRAQSGLLRTEKQSIARNREQAREQRLKNFMNPANAGNPASPSV